MTTGLSHPDILGDEKPNPPPGGAVGVVDVGCVVGVVGVVVGFGVVGVVGGSVVGGGIGWVAGEVALIDDGVDVGVDGEVEEEGDVALGVVAEAEPVGVFVVVGAVVVAAPGAVGDVAVTDFDDDLPLDRTANHSFSTALATGLSLLRIADERVEGLMVEEGRRPPVRGRRRGP